MSTASHTRVDAATIIGRICAAKNGHNLAAALA